eukprot:1971476-Amphidinium_carterae.1
MLRCQECQGVSHRFSWRLLPMYKSTQVPLLWLLRQHSLHRIAGALDRAASQLEWTNNERACASQTFSTFWIPMSRKAKPRHRQTLESSPTPKIPPNNKKR